MIKVYCHDELHCLRPLGCSHLIVVIKLWPSLFQVLFGPFYVSLQFSTARWVRAELYSTLPKTNIAPENRPSQKETIVFQPFIFRGELLVSGRVLPPYSGRSNSDPFRSKICRSGREARNGSRGWRQIQRSMARDHEAWVGGVVFFVWSWWSFFGVSSSNQPILGVDNPKFTRALNPWWKWSNVRWGRYMLIHDVVLSWHPEGFFVATCDDPAYPSCEEIVGWCVNQVLNHD